MKDEEERESGRLVNGVQEKHFPFSILNLSFVIEDGPHDQ
jgi:hypothetical protein